MTQPVACQKLQNILDARLIYFGMKNYFNYLFFITYSFFRFNASVYIITFILLSPMLVIAYEIASRRLGTGELGWSSRFLKWWTALLPSYFVLIYVVRPVGFYNFHYYIF